MNGTCQMNSMLSSCSGSSCSNCNWGCNNCSNGCNGCSNGCGGCGCGCGDGFGYGCAGELVNAIIGLTIIQSILALVFGGVFGFGCGCGCGNTAA